jgi:hypothetical protein
MLTFNSPFCPNSINYSNYSAYGTIRVRVLSQLYVKDSSRDELAM